MLRQLSKFASLASLLDRFFPCAVVKRRAEPSTGQSKRLIATKLESLGVIGVALPRLVEAGERWPLSTLKRVIRQLGWCGLMALWHIVPFPES
jgi:hypothetical protein